jgi:hypothetical protein
MNATFNRTESNQLQVRFQILTAASIKMTVFWDVVPYSLVVTLMIEAVSTSKTSVNFYQTTQRIIPEDSHLIQNYG